MAAGGKARGGGVVGMEPYNTKSCGKGGGEELARLHKIPGIKTFHEQEQRRHGENQEALGGK